MRADATRYRRFRLTREGKAYLFVTVGVGFAAVNTGNNLLYLVLGMQLSLLLVSGVLSDLTLWKTRLSRRLPTQMFVGSPCEVEIALQNGKGRSESRSITVIDTVDLHADGIVHFDRVGAGAIEHLTYTLVPMQRGRIIFSSLRSETRFPFGLIEKGFSRSARNEGLVFPALRRCSTDPTPAFSLGELVEVRTVGVGAELTGGVREYRQGDRVRDVHWRKTALRGEIIIKERQAESSHVVVVHIRNVFTGRGRERTQWREALETTLSEVAYAGAELLSGGSSLRLSTDSGDALSVEATSDPTMLWRFLALVQVLDQGTHSSAPPERAPAWTSFRLRDVRTPGAHT